MYMIIYKTTNLINGKIYVGKDSFNDPSYLGSGLILSRAIKKHGVHNFTKQILETCNSPKELETREQYWIKTLGSTDRKIGYNIALGGNGGDTYTHQTIAKQKSIIKKRENTRPIWDTPEYREKIRSHTIKLWKNPQHREHMTKVMSGRKISWSDKISKSITEWHKTNPITKNGRQRMSDAGKKANGRKLKPISKELGERILEMYKIMGPRLIASRLQVDGHDVSRFIITNFLKSKGVYQKWQKGIGDKSNKIASISKLGNLNPMYKGE